MRRLRQTISVSSLLALIVAFTFTVSQAQDTSNSQKSANRNGELLLGKVINARTGQALANAAVTVSLNDSSQDNYRIVKTNRDGLFMVTGLAKGDHLIKVKEDGYRFWKNIIYVPLLNKHHPGGPLNGFFRPNNESNGWLHGVFHPNNNNNHPSNVYQKNLFVVIGLEMK